MCNFYTERKSAAEVAAHFGIKMPIQTNAGGEVYPGGTGLVVREVAGERVMEAMTWGWPMKFKGMSEAAKAQAGQQLRRHPQELLGRKRPQARVALPHTADGLR